MMLRWAAFIVVAVCACAKQPSTTDSKVLNYSIRSEPASFDPIHSAYIVNAALQRQILECLFEYDYDSDGAELSNLLVETYEVSDSGLIYDFHLNTDAEFFDPFTPPLFEGSQRRAVTANDVLFCWLRQADARNKGEGWWAMRDTIVGLDDFHQQTLALEPGVAQAAVDEALVNGIAGLQVINSTHLQVNLVRPDPMFLNRLAMSYFAVYPHEAVSTDERSMDAQPVGSGAYFLDSFLSGQSVSMAKTPQWRLNYVDAAEKINFEVIRDNQTTIEMFKRGNTDRLTLSHLSADQFLNEQLQLKPEFVEKGVTMSDYPRSDTTMLVFNMDDPDIGHIAGDTHGNNNRRQLRKALSYAFPRQQWQQLLYGDLPHLLASSFVPPNIGSTHTQFPWHDDINEARKLLKNAGYYDGLELPQLEFVLFGTDSLSVALGELYVAALGELDINCSLLAVPYAQQIQKAVSGEAQMFIRNWSLDWPDSSLIYNTFNSNNIGTETNLSHFANSEFDSLLLQLRACSDQNQRQHLEQQLDDILYAECPAAPIEHRQSLVLSSNKISNFKMRAFDLMPCKSYKLNND